MKKEIKVMGKNGEVKNALLSIECCVAAGYTGRRQDVVQSHIEELQKLGIPTPYSVPALYWISPHRIRDGNEVYVIGEYSSMEVEFFLASDEHGRRYFTVASDHTDRELESVSTSKSKQICDKIVGDEFWFVDEVDDHWDSIQLQARVMVAGKWQKYQNGVLGDLLHWNDLENIIARDNVTSGPLAIFGGTLPIIAEGTIYSEACEITMIDPLLSRSITKQYRVHILPDRS